MCEELFNPREHDTSAFTHILPDAVGLQLTTSSKIEHRGGHLQISTVFGRVDLGTATVSGTVVELLTDVVPFAVLQSRFDTAADLAIMYFTLDELHRIAAVDIVIDRNGAVCARFVPLRASPRTHHRNCKQVLSMSRFAYLRKIDHTAILSSPLADWDVSIYDSSLFNVCFRLICDQTPKAYTSGREDDSTRFLWLLLSTSFLTASENDPEVESDVLAQWEFHDLLFYRATRSDLRSKPAGGTFRFKGKFPPLPAIMGEPSERQSSVEFSPSCNDMQSEILGKLSERRSVRSYGTDPLSLEDLMTFLYFSARVLDVDTGGLPQTQTRSYPSAGAIHELEFYVVVNACKGLPPGIYRYDGVQNILFITRCRQENFESVIHAARGAARIDRVQVVVVLAARFQRVSWKYERLAFSLILKNAGVAVDHMYSVARELGLGACALGAGDAIDFSKAIGTNWLERSSVAELLLGSTSNSP